MPSMKNLLVMALVVVVVLAVVNRVPAIKSITG